MRCTPPAPRRAANGPHRRPPRLIRHDGAATAPVRDNSVRRNVGAGRACRRGEPGPGLSRRGRAAGNAEGRARRHRERCQSVPAGDGHRAAAAGHRRPAPSAFRHRLRPRHRGAGDGRGDRGHRVSGARLGRTRLGGTADRAVLRLLFPGGGDGRRTPGGRTADPRRPRLCSGCRRAAPGGDTSNPGADRQFTAQSDRRGAQRHRTGGHRGDRGGGRPFGDYRRGLRAPGF